MSKSIDAGHLRHRLMTDIHVRDFTPIVIETPFGSFEELATVRFEGGRVILSSATKPEAVETMREKIERAR